MTSILTNSSAYVALETLRGINRDLSGVQNEISTGKKISSARDNSAIWAVATTIESDIGGFEQISDSLNLGTSTVGVARVAAESITERLQDIKSRIVGAQEENVDSSKFQTEIEELTAEITSIVNAAQFNGLNLIDGTSEADVSFLSSLDRDANGNVAASSIAVSRQNLSLTNTGGTQSFGAGAVTDGTYATITANGATTDAVTTDAANIIAGQGATAVISIASAVDGASYRIVLDDTDTANDQTNEIGQRTFEYVASGDDSVNGVAANLSNQINNFFSAVGVSNYTVSYSGADITITNNNANAAADLDVTAQTATTGTSATQTGGLGGLSNINVNGTDAELSSALTEIETLLTRSIDAAAEFGSSQSRIENQSEFVTQLTAALTTGVGSLVDADLEAASAKLNALQVQQQLGTQALSIANQAPQQLLSLFR